MMELSQDRTWVGRLKAPASRGDLLSRQLALSRMFAQVDLRPAAQSAGSILCVRHLSAPQRDWPQPNWPRRNQIDTAQEQLDSLHSRAARPGLGPVPTGVDAVLFRDLAEMQACLLRDWAAGRCREFWWWRHIGGVPFDDVRATQWMASQPSAVPQAILLLCENAEIATVWPNLPTAPLSTVHAAVCAAFGVPRARPRAEISESHTSSAMEEPVAMPTRNSRPPLAELPPRVLALIQAIDWRRNDPESACILLTLITLGVAPQFARTDGFLASVDAIAEHWKAEASLPASVPEQQSPASPGAADRYQPASHRLETKSPPQPRDIAPAPRTAKASAPAVSPRKDDIPATHPREASSSRTTRRPASMDPEPTAASRAPDVSSSEVLAPAIESEFAGTLLLLNVALGIGLYGDFTQPAHWVTNLSPWDFLHLLARQQIGNEFENDPLAALLTDLAGRDAAEQPGVRALTPTLWRPHHFALTESPGESWSEWAAWLAAGIKPWLSRVLDHSDPLPWLITRPGTLRASPTRVDAYFSIATHPLAIRMAGLDRDPGFLPAAGKDIRFHFAEGGD